MRVFLIVVVIVLGAVVAGVAFFPLSIAAGFIAERASGLSYDKASGTLWNGKFTNTTFRGQKLGDVSFNVEFLKLLTGKFGGKLGIDTGDLEGEGGFSYGLFDRKADLHGVKLTGKTAQIPGMPLNLKVIDGGYRVEVERIDLSGDGCSGARGRVWTDLLAKGGEQLGWAGPELAGPIACEGGRLTARVSGASPGGDRAEAKVYISLDLRGDAVVTLTPAKVYAEERLSRSGFKPVGNGQYEMSMRLGR